MCMMRAAHDDDTATRSESIAGRLRSDRFDLSQGVNAMIGLIVDTDSPNSPTAFTCSGWTIQRALRRGRPARSLDGGL